MSHSCVCTTRFSKGDLAAQWTHGTVLGGSMRRDRRERQALDDIVCLRRRPAREPPRDNRERPARRHARGLQAGAPPRARFPYAPAARTGPKVLRPGGGGGESGWSSTRSPQTGHFGHADNGDHAHAPSSQSGATPSHEQARGLRALSAPAHQAGVGSNPVWAFRRLILHEPQSPAPAGFCSWLSRKPAILPSARSCHRRPPTDVS